VKSASSLLCCSQHHHHHHHPHANIITYLQSHFEIFVTIYRPVHINLMCAGGCTPLIPKLPHAVNDSGIALIRYGYSDNRPDLSLIDATNSLRLVNCMIQTLRWSFRKSAHMRYFTLSEVYLRTFKNKFQHLREFNAFSITNNSLLFWFG
jgi:hypothetical protein